MRLRLHALILAPCAILMFVANANGISVSHPLPNNPSALPGFHGTANWTLSGGQLRLNVDVDYAVFAPGAYPRDLSNFLAYMDIRPNPDVPFPNPAPNDYLYAYQIYNSPGSNDNLLALSVGIFSDQLVHSLGRDLGFDPGGVDAPWAGLGSDGVKYFLFFPGDGLLPGQFSAVLLLASPNAPTYHSSYVQSALTAERLLPSPVPTPTAAIAGIVGLLSLAAWKFPRRQ